MLNDTHIPTRRAAELLGVGTNHIRALLKRERLQGFKVGEGWMISTLSLLAYLDSRQAEGRPRSGTIRIDAILQLLT